MADIRLVRLQTYTQDLHKLYFNNNYHKRTGRRLLEWQEIQERLAICSTCEEFNGRKCNLCGCCGGSSASHFNMLAFPTKRCPKDPPLWTEKE